MSMRKCIIEQFRSDSEHIIRVHRYKMQFVLLVAAVLGFVQVVPAQWGPSVVDTNTGKIQGKLTDTARVFSSVPYARKPERWKDPQPPFPWPGILQTTTDPPGCPQTMPCGLPTEKILCPKTVSEDCLFLNVFTPLTATTTSKLPVMAFFHGGNFIKGYSNALIYDGEFIANTTSTVVVTVNYRLGAIGFLVYGDDDSGPRGNYGFKDQRLALEWIQDNIANFGGDPAQVTFWGQSAGAVSGAVHMTSVKSAGLFSKAILESEPFSITLKTVGKAKLLGEQFAKELGCSDLDCLYKKNLTEIAKAQDAVLSKIIDIFHVMEVFLQWTPIIDGIELTDQPINMFAKGAVAPMPMIVGTTSEETVYFVYDAFTSPMPGVQADELELAIFQEHYTKVHNRYPSDYGADNRPQAAVLGTAYTFTCPTRYALQGLVARQQQQLDNPIWLYVFNHSFSFDGWGKFSFCNGHSCHGAELPYVFHTAELGGFKYTSDELAMADALVTYWTTFAHTGNPNPFVSHPPVPDWPAYRQNYTSQVFATMKFKTPKSEVVEDYESDTCNFWDSIGYYK